MSSIISKVLIPNKEWIIEDSGNKIGSIAKNKKGYVFLHKGEKVDIKGFNDLVDKLDTIKTKHNFKTEHVNHNIYNYPCSSTPFEPMYNVKMKIPLYAKSSKSKSQYCAGYYIIQFKKGWVKSFCPKLITLERNKFCGPFKTEQEMKNKLNSVNNHEPTKLNTHRRLSR